MDVLIPGSYNPIHKGHVKIYLHLLDMGHIPSFGVTRNSFGKTDLPPVEERTKQFQEHWLPYVILEGKTLIQHYKQYTHFVGSNQLGLAIGHDTFERFLNINLSHMGTEKLLLHCLDKMKNVTFFVFPRNGKLKVESDILPQKLVYMEDYEEVNISSTEIRNAKS